MQSRVLILGAGFAGLELATILSEELGDDAGVTLIDDGDAFVLGYAKLEVMFGRAALEDVRMPYGAFAKPGVTFRRERVLAIEPESRRATTSAGVHDADVLVVALGATFDYSATPGLVPGENEFYSVAGANRLRELLPAFERGRAVVGICGAPYKCPPAPSEAALLLHAYLAGRGVRDACEITLVTPLGRPVPPSPDTSAALAAAFAERGIELVTERRVASVDAGRRVVGLDDGTELACDLLLGVPKHRVPDVVRDSGLSEGGFVPVEPRTLETRFPGVYALGDVADVGVAKAGVFAEGAARVVAGALLARLRGGEAPTYDGRGSCFVEFGGGLVGRVDVDFFAGPTPIGTFHAPSDAIAAEKRAFGAGRRERWFGS